MGVVEVAHDRGKQAQFATASDKRLKRIKQHIEHTTRIKSRGDVQGIGIGKFALDDIDQTDQRVEGEELRQACIAISPFGDRRGSSSRMKHQLFAEGTSFFAFGGLPGEDLVPINAMMFENGIQEFQQIGRLIDDLASGIGVK